MSRPAGDHPLADPTAVVGRWRLDRTIVDRRAGATSRVEGSLEVTEDGPGLLGWRERGTWHTGGHAVPVHRTLAVVRDARGWWVRFEDGRDFHAWAPGEAVVHPCAPDTYTGLVDGAPDRWTVTWSAVGPEKDYDMTTVLLPPG